MSISSRARRMEQPRWAEALIAEYLHEKLGEEDVPFKMERQLSTPGGSDDCWAFWIMYEDDNGYLHANEKFEFYGTSFRDPDVCQCEFEDENVICRIHDSVKPDQSEGEKK